MIRPTGHNVLLGQLPPKAKSDGGIMFPQTYDPYSRGAIDYVVIAVGPKCDPAITPGALVVLDQFRINSKVEAGNNMWLVRESSLAMVIPR